MTDAKPRGGVIYNRGTGRQRTNHGINLSDLEPILGNLLDLGYIIRAPVREPGCNCPVEYVPLTRECLHDLVNGRGWGSRKLAMSEEALARIASGEPRPENETAPTTAAPAANATASDETPLGFGD